MKISVIGAGYVGLVAAACFSHMGNSVICMDVDERRIEALKQGLIPIYEPGLESLVKRNMSGKTLRFTNELRDAVAHSLFIFIAVGTPAGQNGCAELKYVLKAAGDIGTYIEEYKIIINKSTVPIGTADRVRSIVEQKLRERNLSIEFDVVSNPEFMKEGDAVNDFMKPDRVVIGADNVRTAALMKEIYSPFEMDRNRLIIMDVRSAEMTKYAANAMLATKISFMNEIANMCERVGADVSKVRAGIGSDRRIGYSFIYPGLGYGGSCFPKDVRALIATAEECSCDARIIRAVDEVNRNQRNRITEKIKRFFSANGGTRGRTAAVWGLSFKPNTNDVRESPALDVVRSLLDCGVSVQAYDPEAIEQAKMALGEDARISYFNNAYQALKGADFLVLTTEWHLFRNPDFEQVKTLLKQPVVFDGRNQYDPGDMRAKGFEYFSIGR